MKVTITEAAWPDMLSIGLNIKNDSPSRASNFVDRLYDRCQSLGAMPHAFALDILHGAMDYERILSSGMMSRHGCLDRAKSLPHGPRPIEPRFSGLRA